MRKRAGHGVNLEKRSGAAWRERDPAKLAASFGSHCRLGALLNHHL
jgi:hypothetical protein